MKSERLFALFLVVLAAVFCLGSLELDFLAEDGGIGPGFFPISLSTGLLVVTVAYAVTTVVPVAGRPADEPGPAITRDQLLLLASVLLTVLLGPSLGLVVAVAALLLASLLVIQKLSVVRSLAFTVGSIAFIYLVFDVWLGINLATGLLGWMV